jgi:hypothetical protein
MSYIQVKALYNRPRVSLSITLLSHEETQAGFHAFQTGQYEHDGFLLTLNFFAMSLPEAQNQSEAFDVQSTAS